jgi:hypothetical protein
MSYLPGAIVDYVRVDYKTYVAYGTVLVSYSTVLTAIPGYAPN